MRHVLVLGGTRFFGKKLVERLLEAGDQVTIVSRGAQEHPFGDRVQHLQVDRTDAEALESAIGEGRYDVVYDNICYNPKEAEEAVKLFAGRTSKYIVTSTLSVYPFGEPRKSESFFDSVTYPIPQPYPAEINYGEGKRLVEAVFFQKASFPVAAVRFPIVLGDDDYTRRLHFHVEHVQQGLPLGIPNADAVMSFIDADEAAAFLDWLGRNAETGPFNACSRGEISPGGIVAWIEKATGKQAYVALETDEQHSSPFGVPEPWYMDTAKAEAAGYKFRELHEWMLPLIERIAQEKK
ncbi:NAD-dependent epimerase/dehydratase family protein [Paenibacillus sp. CF384]|uniref:NAD-dependent epimerase/dehydratase family protein n=1 Tax=Paenibacillus sp. CF384 TaxID=1884382 RepID=UPI00089B3C05|nr:NAD-dependent epimerase/dehydratase family protein [Paenibacillus sp. CF384]SDX31500.1 Nucleoside-diphosphate-sugar epimerase [Paenibacillus sp. CF384]